MVRDEIDFSEAPACGVGASGLCPGQGLFALRLIRKGEIVCNYGETSRHWRPVPFREIPDDYRSSCWWVGASEEVALLAAKESSFMRANHSGNPNTHWDTRSRTLTAERDISPGEEITFDYRLEVAPAWLKESPPSWA